MDKLNEGLISLKDVPTLLREVGQNPTEAELETILTAVDAKKEKKITFEEYLKIQERPDAWKPHGTYDDFVKEFSVFDSEGTGFISSSELRYVLTALGEPLTDKQVDELLRSTDKGGKVKYSGTEISSFSFLFSFLFSLFSFLFFIQFIFIFIL